MIPIPTLRLPGRIRLDLFGGWLPTVDGDGMFLFEPRVLWFWDAPGVLAFLDEHPGLLLHSRHFERRWIQRCYVGRLSESARRRGERLVVRVGELRAYRPPPPRYEEARPRGLLAYDGNEPLDWSDR